jgi:hypothetical protein
MIFLLAMHSVSWQADAISQARGPDDIASWPRSGPVHERSARPIIVPERRPGRDGHTPATEHELVQMFEEELPEDRSGFASMVEAQTIRGREIDRGG